MEIEVCLVAGRRPDLLRRTLESFDRLMFANFKVARILANIDPIFGDDADHAESVRVIQKIFPTATIFEPPEPGFCKAVQRVWSSTSAGVIFHMEDDWVLNRAIEPSEIAPLIDDPRIKQIALNTVEKGWDSNKRGHFSYVRKRIPILWGLLQLRPKFPAFSTSPAFSSGPFLRRAAELMDPQFDPEKQFYYSINQPLEDFVRPYRALVLGNKPNFPITDIGREWRNERHISKRIVKGNSVWTKDEGAV